MDNVNLYKTVLLPFTNVVFANTDNFASVDKRLSFINNILHRGIIDCFDEEVDIAYKTLLIFVAIIHMNESLNHYYKRVRKLGGFKETEGHKYFIKNE